jgi:hypothetical protein
MISEEAHTLLRRQKKGPKDSFTQVILRHLQPPADTCGELLERIEHSPPPRINLKRMRRHIKQRGRRSPRP